MRRAHNEDACLERPEIGLWVVADGMGGHAAGDVASTMIIDAMREISAPSSLSSIVTDVEERLTEVNRRLKEIAAQRERHTIGSTMAALIVYGSYCVCLWVGDSRIYRYRGGRLEQLTHDHALVAEMVAQGLLSRQDAESHPQANLVTRAVGATDALFVDLEIFDIDFGDIYVLCTDGLTKELGGEEIAEVLGRENDAKLSDVLVNIALSRGARDNVTVAAVRIENGTAGTGVDAVHTLIGGEDEATVPHKTPGSGARPD